MFLFIFGNLIPLKAPGLVIKDLPVLPIPSIFLQTVVFKYALDGLLRVSFSTAVLVICGIMAVGALVMFAMKKMEKKKNHRLGGGCGCNSIGRNVQLRLEENSSRKKRSILILSNVTSSSAKEAGLKFKDW